MAPVEGPLSALTAVLTSATCDALGNVCVCVRLCRQHVRRMERRLMKRTRVEWWD